MSTVKLPFYARLALTLLAIVLIFMVLKAGADIFIPLVFSLLISILLYPATRFMETRLHFGRVVAAMTSVVVFVAAASGFIYFLALQVIGFADDFPELRKRFWQMFGNLQHWISYKLHITNKQQTAYINQSANSMLASAAHSATNIFASLTGLLLTLIFILIFTFFMLYHRRLLIRFVLHLFNVPHREKVKEVIFETKSMINSYVLGLVTEMVLLIIVTCTVFLIMGIKYAILLGIMAAVLNIIPYLGIYTSILLTMLVTFANSSGPTALGAGIALFIIHVLDSNILFPRIVGGRVKMNPFITIIAVIVGEQLWGVPGMFLFIPMAGIMKLVCERVDGMQAWALLIGVEEAPPKVKKARIAPSENGESTS